MITQKYIFKALINEDKMSNLSGQCCEKVCNRSYFERTRLSFNNFKVIFVRKLSERLSFSLDFGLFLTFSLSGHGGQNNIKK